MDSQLIFLIIIVIILVSIKLFYKKENFTDCSQFYDYNQCYNNNCTVMIDLKGNSFCTNK
jgi:hypothetical protein